ncbi:hypothetical protein JTE90_025289 [Oedothorax gibbosus]|uniref:Neuron-derived neurotrophic factor N-terminal domain-containing protein n=1 Tax=Oedothorax gibbosus TaxID=931172 RepID=A0AAV6TTV7_9ARAC|nr:hypothetical protein JTE90_025289 [Oedothorax gibbosus]
MLLFYVLFQSLLSFAVSAKEPLHSAKTFFYPKYRHDRFYDTKIIPEDTEVDVYLRKGHTQKLFFILDGGYRPISLTVTPCSRDALIEWKIAHTSFESHPSEAAYRSGRPIVAIRF